MKQYLDLMGRVITRGRPKGNRTGVETLWIPGAMMQFDLADGFPAVTTKKLAFKTAMRELVGFLRGYTSAKDFRDLGCKIWDQNANDNLSWLNNPYRQGEDDLGPVYGAQWTAWPAYREVSFMDHAGFNSAKEAGYKTIGTRLDGGNRMIIMRREVNQFRECVREIIRNPDSRRILFHAWNPAQLDMMALPPCHLLYHFMPDHERKELHMSLYVRSNDLFLGAPFNIAEGAALMHLVGRVTGYFPRIFSYFIGDAHIYNSHMTAVLEQLQREPHPLPALRLDLPYEGPNPTLDERMGLLDHVTPDCFALESYHHGAPLTAPMAV